MDSIDGALSLNHEAEPFPAAEAEAEPGREPAPFLHLLTAMQKSAVERRLDAGLAILVTDHAADFAALSPREQAAIAWVEAVISSGKPQSADGAYAALHRYFDDPAIAKLTALAGTASARAKLGTLRRG
jgi:alkylhydroperoxidase family enzyme